MTITSCDESFSNPILAILNEAIVTSTALYDYKPRSSENMVAWFAAKRAGNFPIIGAVAGDGELMGFASFGAFRNFPAYKYTVEHSVYVAKSHRGKGLGKVLLERITDEAQRQNYHVLVGAIDATNPVSIALHKSLGFTHAGTLRQVGFKFGRWLDLEFYQKILNTPTNPTDG